jgi:hypothetical protein
MLSPKFVDIGGTRGRSPNDSGILESRKSVEARALRDACRPGYFPAREASASLGEGPKERYVARDSEDDVEGAQEEFSTGGLESSRHVSIITLI